ncbi:MAG: hypothetical protein BWY83_00393 [bacterium ADurb.Bin478]|nr:MAG: hypothetical protein BWY83_00393 [bacterium ADurb.Bin478]
MLRAPAIADELERGLEFERPHLDIVRIRRHDRGQLVIQQGDGGGADVLAKGAQQTAGVDLQQRAAFDKIKGFARIRQNLGIPFRMGHHRNVILEQAIEKCLGHEIGDQVHGEFHQKVAAVAAEGGDPAGKVDVGLNEQFGAEVYADVDVLRRGALNQFIIKFDDDRFFIQVFFGHHMRRADHLADAVRRSLTQHLHRRFPGIRSVVPMR